MKSCFKILHFRVKAISAKLNVLKFLKKHNKDKDTSWKNVQNKKNRLIYAEKDKSKLKKCFFYVYN